MLYGRTVYDGPRIEPDGPELRWLWRQRVLRLGVLDRDQPPLDALGTGRTYEGISADYASLLAEQLNLDMTVQVFPSFEAASTALHQGEIDLLGSVTARQAQQAGLLLSPAYAEDWPLLLAPEPRPAVGRDEPLRLVMVEGYRTLEQVREYYPNAQVQQHPAALSAIAALTLGQADLYLGSAMVARHVQRRSQFAGVVEVGHAAMPPQDIGFAMQDNGTPLPALVAQAMNNIDQSQRADISARWDLGSSTMHATRPLRLDEAQQRWLQGHPTVRVLINDQMLPLSYRDSTGQLRGLTLDALKLVSRRTGLNFEVQAVNDVQQMVAQVMQGKAELIAGVVYSEALAQQLSFSRAYLSAPRVLVTRSGVSLEADLDRLAGHTVALVYGSAMGEQLRRRYPEVRQRRVKSALDALHDVARGKADAAILTLDSARALIARWYPGRLEIKASLAMPPAHFALAGALGPHELLGILDEALLSLSPRETEALVRRWRHPVIVPDGVWARYRSKVLFGFGTALVLLLLALLWIRYLRRLQVALRRAKQDAEAANQAKTSFLTTMSHEIRTPLHALMGMLELTQRKATQGVLDRSAIEVATDAARGLHELIGDILDISRIETGNLQLAPQRVRLREQVERVLQLFEQQARGKGLALVLKTQGAIDAEVMLDPLRFKQVMANLLSNAVKFTRQGQVMVSLSAVPRGEKLEVWVHVRDTGMGIAAAELAGLGQPFRQASNQRQSARCSAGLGLSICRSLCQMMGGQLRLSSILGKGTTVAISLYLPLLSSDDPVASAVPARAERSEVRLRVLVVDDYPANRLLLAQQLDYLGHRTRVAEDGSQALRLWLKEHFDVVISDCSMPRLNGHGLARAIREHERRSGRPPCRLIGLTANAQESERLACRAAGMDDCLFKPLVLDSLVQALAGCEACPDASQQDPEPLDLQQLWHLVGKDQAAFRALLRDLRASNHEDLQRLRRHDLAPAALARLAHRVKGGARIVRAEGLVGLCEDLERCCLARPQDTQAVHLAVQALAEAMMGLELHLDRRAAPGLGGHIMPSSNNTNRITSTTPMMPDGP
ncbi:response regulator [Pseudomonas sp. NPDC089996]|uniref:response regulator n=1 Tax=Pseudomonas sp. NPDC089996 TaxID=3364474 RepID=UPI0038088280